MSVMNFGTDIAVVVVVVSDYSLEMNTAIDYDDGDWDATNEPDRAMTSDTFAADCCCYYYYSYSPQLQPQPPQLDYSN